MCARAHAQSALKQGRLATDTERDARWRSDTAQCWACRIPTPRSPPDSKRPAASPQPDRHLTGLNSPLAPRVRLAWSPVEARCSVVVRRRTAVGLDLAAAARRGSIYTAAVRHRSSTDSFFRLPARQPFWKTEYVITILRQLGGPIEGLWQLRCGGARAQQVYPPVQVAQQGVD